MPRQSRHILPLQADKIFLGLLACAYVGYLITFGHFLFPGMLAPASTITTHSVDTLPNVAVKHWTVSSMRHAIDADQQDSNTSNLTQESSNKIQGKATMQQGQAPRDGNLSYPLSTVGKVFFSNNAGKNMTCSGTAISSLNSSVVDTAGHCIYHNNEWMQNVIFCPLYDNGATPYGCWAASGLEVPSDWTNAKPNDYHHDFGMLIVAPNSYGLLTDVVGGAGWAYNQSIDQPFYAYGYPAGYPFDGQTRQSCESTSGTAWQHGTGNVISIPCNMTGGSSGGPWFIKVGNNLYLNGHNDFISGIQLGHMFSPYYDDTWYALYNKAQHS